MLNSVPSALLGSHCERSEAIQSLVSKDRLLRRYAPRNDARHGGSHFTSEHPPSAIGRNACSAGMVETSL